MYFPDCHLGLLWLLIIFAQLLRSHYPLLAGFKGHGYLLHSFLSLLSN
ncbi:MAG: hypothetical protein ACHBN1_17765 [Heteroscytonema crispum UTEX LB 1556]